MTEVLTLDFFKQDILSRIPVAYTGLQKGLKCRLPFSCLVFENKSNVKGASVVAWMRHASRLCTRTTSLQRRDARPVQRDTGRLANLQQTELSEHVLQT